MQTGVQAHPYYNSFVEFQQPYTYFNEQHFGNNASTSTNNYANEFPLNRNYRYAGGFTPSERYLSLFSDKSMHFMSAMITQGLKGVHPQNKNIVVPRATIESVADSVYQNTGQSAQIMQQMVISYIIDYVRTEFANTQKNNAYSAWVQKYDEETGLQQFSDVKLNNRMRSAYFQIRY